MQSLPPIFSSHEVSSSHDAHSTASEFARLMCHASLLWSPRGSSSRSNASDSIRIRSHSLARQWPCPSERRPAKKKREVQGLSRRAGAGLGATETSGHTLELVAPSCGDSLACHRRHVRSSRHRDSGARHAMQEHATRMSWGCKAANMKQAEVVMANKSARILDPGELTIAVLSTVAML